MIYTCTITDPLLKMQVSLLFPSLSLGYSLFNKQVKNSSITPSYQCDEYSLHSSWDMYSYLIVTWHITSLTFIKTGKTQWQSIECVLFEPNCALLLFRNHNLLTWIFNRIPPCFICHSLAWRTKWSDSKKLWSISQLPPNHARPAWGPPPSSVSWKNCTALRLSWQLSH